jgi:flagellar motor switch/type III secretory pathway protein FliN
MTSRPFRLYGESDSTKVLDYSRSVVRAWSECWIAQVASDTPIEARLLDVAVAPAQNWLHLASDIDHQFGFQMEGDLATDLPKMLYGGTCDDSRSNQSGILDKELFDSMLADLAARFLKKPVMADTLPDSLTSAAISAEVKLPGAGFMLARVSVTSVHHFWILMNSQFIDSILGASDRRASRTTTVSPIQAIGNRPVTLELAVGTGELTIDELSSLAVGDVIPLDRKLNEEINVCINSDAPICRGYMGVKQGRVAVQLLSNS